MDIFDGLLVVIYTSSTMCRSTVRATSTGVGGGGGGRALPPPHVGIFQVSCIVLLYRSLTAQDVFGLVYWGLTPQQQPGSYQGGEMMMKSDVFHDSYQLL